VIPGGFTENLSSHPNAPLIKAVTRAYRWYEMLMTGEVRSMRAIANQIGTTERYVGRIIRCAFLAPDIVEAIIAGRQPPAVSVEVAMRFMAS
jgi:hypothetical protein